MKLWICASRNYRGGKKDLLLSCCNWRLWEAGNLDGISHSVPYHYADTHCYLSTAKCLSTDPEHILCVRKPPLSKSQLSFIVYQAHSPVWGPHKQYSLLYPSLSLSLSLSIGLPLSLQLCCLSAALLSIVIKPECSIQVHVTERCSNANIHAHSCCHIKHNINRPSVRRQNYSDTRFVTATMTLPYMQSIIYTLFHPHTHLQLVCDVSSSNKNQGGKGCWDQALIFKAGRMQSWHGPWTCRALFVLYTRVRSAWWCTRLGMLQALHLSPSPTAFENFNRY